MAQRIYEPAAYQASSLDGCYWVETTPDGRACPPLEGTATADVAVIGAGFAGLAAALRLAQAGRDVAVLDLHLPGWGASGRNGGFCCMGGSMISRAAMIRRFGADQHGRFCAAELASIDYVRGALDRYGIDADTHSQGGELQLAHSPAAMRDLRDHVAEVRQDFGLTAHLLRPDELAGQGMSGHRFHGGLIMPAGFALNPRKYALGLADAALDAGVRTHGDSPVTSIRHSDGRYHLSTPQGRLVARQLLVATNGYASDDLPDWMRALYLPVQSSVIVTDPLTPDQIAAQGWSTDLMAYDSRNLLHYFRLMPDRRFLFGMRGGIAWTGAEHRLIRRRITAHFHRMFPAWADARISHFWSGFVNLTRDLVPYAGGIGDWPDAFAAFGWHGNGVAMASWTGDQIARRMLGQADDLPGFYSRDPRRFELGRHRRLALRAAYAWYSLTEG